jgi:hypothetical protein
LLILGKHSTTELYPQPSTFFFFLLGYICCTGNSLWQFGIGLHCTLVRCPFHHPLDPSLPHIKQLQEVSLFYFVYANEAHQPYSFTFTSSIHLPFPINTPSPTVPILQSCLLLLIPNSMFLVYPCCEYTLLWSVHPFHLFFLRQSLAMFPRLVMKPWVQVIFPIHTPECGDYRHVPPYLGLFLGSKKSVFSNQDSLK